MRRKDDQSKRTLLALTLPLVMLTIATIAYAAYSDRINVEMTLGVWQKPTITIDSQLTNAPTNKVAIIVNNETRTIEDTLPTPLEILITITNTGTTPINALTINETLPNDWSWTQQLSIMIVRQSTDTQIPENQYTTTYDGQTLLITIPDIKTATGQKQNQDEAITASLTIEYKLKRETLPPEYENNPPTYENTATATAMTEIESWKSEPACSTLSFTTSIIFDPVYVIF
jgi:hypothetical protein